MSSAPKRAKKQILDLNNYVDKEIMVKFVGGREVSGVLKGYDSLMNLVIDECLETLNNDDQQSGENENPLEKMRRRTRKLGLVVARSTTIALIAPMNGMEQIENPFVNANMALS